MEVQALKYKRIDFLKDLHQRVLSAVGTGRTLGRDEMEKLVDNAIDKVTASIEPPAELGWASSEDVRRSVRQNILGYGPLDDLLKDETLSDIMVNRYDEIFVERGGRLEEVKDSAFLDNAHLRNVIDRILRNIGKAINDLNPYVDGRLDDGSRINVVIPPVALDGPMLTIRMFPKKPLTIKDLIEQNRSFTPELADFLKIIVRNRKNIIISGGSGSGKTTLLNVISQFIPPEERIITIEDSAELKLSQPHVGRMETRQSNYEGKGEITIRDLVKNALRMRPDRIVVGECRGGEAIDMLQAMNTGHDGSITTIHANSPQDVLVRLETMVTLGGYEIPLSAIRKQIASAIDIIIQVARLADGQRKVIRVSEVVGLDGTEIQLQDLFLFRKDFVTEDGHIEGNLKSVDNFPTFLDHVVPEEREILQRIFVTNLTSSEMR